MNIGSTFNHEKYGPLTIQGKAYSRLGNRVLWVVVDQNGKKMNMEEAELAELIEKSEEKERKEAEKEEIKRQKEIENEQKPMELTKIAEAIRFQKGDPGVDADEERVIQAVIPQVLAQIRLPKDGEPGKDSDVEEVVTKLLPLVMAEMPKPDKPKEVDIPALISKIMARIRIPKDGKPGEDGKPGKDGSPDSPEEIKDKLQSLKGDNRLDARAIKNLPNSQIGGGAGPNSLQHLEDVRLTNPTDNQSLTYDSASGKWVNETVSGGSGSVDSVVAGNNIDVDATDPANPVVSVETLTLADISDVTASVTELNYIDGVTSAIQGQIDGKQAVDSDLTAIAGLTPSNDDIIQRKAGSWINRTMAQLKSDLGLVKADVGLGNVDNTSDANKPVSTATQTALDAKLDDSQLDTDGTLAANSDAKIASQKAVKTYVDSIAQGLTIKESVRLATAAALAANTYSNGASGVGATLTGVATGVLTVDGVAVALNDRILVKDEVTGANNGIYVCTVAGAVGVAYVLTRSTSFDLGTEISGAFTFVEEGTANADNGYVCTTNDPITVGTTALSFTQFSGAGQITAGNALTKTGNTLDVAVDDSSIEISGDALRVKASGITSAMLAGSIDATKIADGSVTSTEFQYIGGLTSDAQTQLDAKVAKSTYDAHTILYATTDNTPVALTVGEQTVVGRATGGNISAIAIDSDLSSVSANDDTIPSAKATKAMGDLKLPLAGGTMTGPITLAENTSIALDPAGSADGKYSGITVTGTAGYTQAFGDLVYLDPTDSRWEAVDANAASGADGDARGMLAMVVSAGTDGNACTLLLQGIIRADANFPAFTINNPIYVSETAGDVTQTQPTTTDAVIRIIGAALTADEMYFNPDWTYTTHT